MKQLIFDRKKKITWYPKSCLILKCFVLGIVPDRAAIHLRGRPGQTAQNHVPGGDWEAGSHTEESDSGWEASTSQDEVLGEGKAGGEEDPSGEARYPV